MDLATRVDRMEDSLERLRDATGETAILGKEQGGAVIYLAVLEGKQNIRYTARPGDLKPLHSSSIGKALLAAKPGRARDEAIAKLRLDAMTENTIVDRARLSEEIELTASRGYSITRGENVVDVMAIASTVKFGGGLPGYYWDGQTKSESEADTAGTQELLRCYRKVCRRSCTLGACPPCGAVLLFDGSQQSLDAHWREGAEMTDDGLLMQGVTSKDEFRDFYVHLEFRLPYMPEARGQARSNSGYYVQGRYEVQMLDSFGLEGLDNECGGIYSVSRPDVNMCLPPLSWQTYDV